MDYWRGLYDLFWCCACGDRLVRDHVGLCNRGGDLGPRWYIPAVVNAAIQGKHGEASLRRLLQVDAIGRPCVISAIAGRSRFRPEPEFPVLRILAPFPAPVSPSTRLRR